MRIIKNVGIAAALALAVTAVIGASAASAAQFEVESGASVVAGAHTTNTEFSFAGYISGVCSTDHFAAGMAKSAASISPEETLEGCSGATVKPAKCGPISKLSAGVETAAGKSQGSFDLSPTGCGPIVISANSGLCTATISPQSGLASVTYETKGSGSGRYIEAAVASSNVSYSTSGFCGTQTRHDGAYSVTFKVAAKDAEGRQVGLYIGTPAHAAQLESASYPTAITGNQVSGKEHNLTVAAGSTTCTTGTLSGEITQAVSELSLNATYSGCTSNQLGEVHPAQVKMNSCHYGLHIANTKAPYGGTADVVCSKEGDAIEVTIETVNPCVIKVGAQSGLSAMSYANGASTVNVTFNLSGINYKQVGVFCRGNNFSKEKSFTNGTLTGTSSLSGSSGYIAITS
jgi:hypothetical protein